MKQKLRIGLCFFLLLLNCSFQQNSENSDLKISAFNISRLGEYDKDYNRLASIILQFDLVGIVEITKPVGVSNLYNAIKVTGKQRAFFISDQWQGSSFYHEYIAYFWNPDKISLQKDIGFYPDPDNLFTRSPYGALFRGKQTDFTFIISHLIWAGDSPEDIARREAEVCALDKVLTYFDQENGSDSDLLLGGDFNLSATNSAFHSIHTKFYFDALSSNTLTTLSIYGPRSDYDHIFYNKIKTTEFSGKAGVLDSTDKNYSDFIQKISDHLPVFIELKDQWDDD